MGGRLTGRQRYRQAIVKQRIVAVRQMREMERGERYVISCPLDDFIVAEFERAYEAGLTAGRTALQEVPHE